MKLVTSWYFYISNCVYLMWNPSTYNWLYSVEEFYKCFGTLCMILYLIFLYFYFKNVSTIPNKIWCRNDNTQRGILFLISSYNLRHQRSCSSPLYTRCVESNRGANKKGDRRPALGHRLIYRTPCHRYLFYWLPFALTFIASHFPDKTTSGKDCLPIP